MTFALHVEHQVVGGKVVLEEFEGVEEYHDPPMTKNLVVKFADERDEKKLNHGNVVMAKDGD